MSERKPAKVERIEQRLDEDFHGDINQHPRQVKQFYTDNFFQRSLSLLQGVTNQMKAKMIEVTNSGAVKVANIGSGIEEVQVDTGTAVAVETGALTAPVVSNKVRFVGVDYDFYFRPSPDGVQFQDQIYIMAGTPTELDLVVTKYKVQRVGSNDANYRIEFYK